MIAGIYQILNLIKGKSYVGQSQNISRRFTTHTWYLGCKKHTNKHLQRSWNKYREENFKFNALEEVEVIIPESIKNYKLRLTAREEFWINHFRPAIYNQRIAADSNLGMKLGPQTAEHTAKISATKVGKKHSAETKAKMSAAKKVKNIQLNTAPIMLRLKKAKLTQLKPKPRFLQL